MLEETRDGDKIELWVEGRAHRFGVDARVYFWRATTRPALPDGD
jgi:hypothetical protein